MPKCKYLNVGFSCLFSTLSHFFFFFFYFPITEGNVSYESSLVISLIVSQNDKISRDKTTEAMIKIRLNGT